MGERPADDEVSSFSQEYDRKSTTPARLTIYCRLCRRIFPVTFKPRPHARLRCLCGHEAPLVELDVFKDEARAREFAKLYEKLYQAAKQALRDANLPVPPTGRFDRIRDGDEPPSDIAGVSESAEDRSDIASSYVGDGSDDRENASERERELRAAIDGAPDVLAKHDALSELVEHLYCIRHTNPDSLERFVAACREDMKLAKDVVKEATKRKREGQKVRVTFTSFKHLAIALEDEGDSAGALEACEGAIALGLGGYDERAARLRASLGASAPAPKPREAGAATHARSRDDWEGASTSGTKPALEPPAKKPKKSGGTAKALDASGPTKRKSSARQKALDASGSRKRKSSARHEALDESAPENRKSSGRSKAVEKKPAPTTASEPPPLGLLSSSSDAIIPASKDLEDLGDDLI